MPTNPPAMLSEKPTQNGYIRLERFADADADKDQFRVTRVEGAKAPPPQATQKDDRQELYLGDDLNKAQEAYDNAIKQYRDEQEESRKKQQSA